MSAIADHRLLGHRISTLTYPAALAAIIARARERAGGAGYFCNVHMAVEGLRDRRLGAAMARADWLFPDGMPIVMALRLLGARGVQRVAGMDAVPALCERAAAAGLTVYFHGGDRRTLDALAERLASAHPGLRIAGLVSPPFRDAGVDDPDEARAIEASGAHLCFVGLGCPKQEHWIARNRARTGAVLLGVGAAFGTTAGTAAMAPQWMRDAGLEWLFRLAQEPSRLVRRYARSNPLFVDRVLREIWSR